MSVSPPLLIPSARTTLTSLSIPFGRSHSYRYAKGTPEGNAFSVPVAYGYARTAPKGLPRLVKVVRAEGISSGGDTTDPLMKESRTPRNKHSVRICSRIAQYE